MMKKTTIVLVLNKQAARRRSGQYLVHELDCPWLHGPAMLVHGGAGGHGHYVRERRADHRSQPHASCC
jgi:hypothetical protein